MQIISNHLPVIQATICLPEYIRLSALVGPSQKADFVQILKCGTDLKYNGQGSIKQLHRC